jgi:hypothetical protein
VRSGRFLNRIQPCKVNLTHTLGISKDRSEATVSPHIPGYGSGPPQATAGPYAHQLCRTYICSATTKPVFLSAMQNVLPHVGACKHKIKVEWWRQVHLPGHSGTRLTAYHISRHVASTFKRLASHHYHTFRP